MGEHPLEPPLADRIRGVALLDDPVRRALYAYVAAQDHPVGREEAARAVGVARALAAFHLDKLAREGVLEVSFRRLSGRSGPGAGRPSKLYRRSALEVDVSLPPRRYRFLARLLAVAIERSGGEPATALVEASGEVGTGLGEEAREVDRPADRQRVLAILEDQGFEPVRDADGSILLRNCPFDALAREFPGLVCSANLAFLRGLVLGLRAHDLDVELRPDPARCCVVFRPSAS
ncbi:MAG TPA: transcriptional regulator [Actinomycetota bacterium]|nr:transcriptional regulator [Actinomycetota bacterium]